MDTTTEHDLSAETPRPAGRPWVKICGLKDEAMIDAALARGADEIGLVHFEPSPRHLDPERIAELVAHVGTRAVSTVVLVDPDDETLDDLLFDQLPVTLQLHGRETPERLEAIRERVGLNLMKAVSVGPDGPSLAIGTYAGFADRLLLDAKAPKGAGLPGGNGVSFDWGLLASIEDLRGVPFMLSGGLNEGNVAEALRIARPAGLDVSSGVETAPGVKSAELIHRFFDALDAATGRETP